MFSNIHIHINMLILTCIYIITIIKRRDNDCEREPRVVSYGKVWKEESEDINFVIRENSLVRPACAYYYGLSVVYSFPPMYSKGFQ